MQLFESVDDSQYKFYAIVYLIKCQMDSALMNILQFIVLYIFNEFMFNYCVVVRMHRFWFLNKHNIIKSRIVFYAIINGLLFLNFTEKNSINETLFVLLEKIIYRSK